MNDDQALILSAIAAAQREMQQSLAYIESKQKQIEMLCAANEKELRESQEAYRTQQAANRDEYRKTQEAYRSRAAAKQEEDRKSQEAYRSRVASSEEEYRKSQEAYRKNEDAFQWSRVPCFITTLIITALVAYIAWRVS
jgi:hypothetical protein